MVGKPEDARNVLLSEKDSRDVLDLPTLFNQINDDQFDHAWVAVIVDSMMDEPTLAHLSLTLGAVRQRYRKILKVDQVRNTRRKKKSVRPVRAPRQP